MRSKLGYVPNRAARSLMTRRSDSVGVVIMEPAGPAVRGPLLRQPARRHQRRCSPTRDVQLVLLMAQSSPRGGAASSGTSRPATSMARSSSGRTATIRCRGASTSAACRSSLSGRPRGDGHGQPRGRDNRGGARMAVAHLLDGGRRSIATIHGTLDMSSGLDRLEGYRDALRDGRPGPRPRPRGGRQLPPGDRCRRHARAAGPAHPGSMPCSPPRTRWRRPSIRVLPGRRAARPRGRRGRRLRRLAGGPDDPARCSRRCASRSRPWAARWRACCSAGSTIRASAPSQVVFATELVVRESSGGS